MTHTLDTSQQTDSSAAPATTTYTCGASCTVLVVGIVADNTRTGGAPTYNGVTMTQAGSTRVATETECELWYLIGPPTGAAHTLSIPNTSTPARQLHIHISSYDSATGESAFDVEGGTNGNSVTASQAVTPTVDGAAVVDIAGTGHKDVPTANSQTQLFSVDDGQYSHNSQYALQGTAGSITFSWTQSGSDDWCIQVAAFKEVSGAVTFAAAFDGSATLAASISPLRGLVAGLDGSADLVAALTPIRTLAATFTASADLVADIEAITPAIEFAATFTGSADLIADLSLVASFVAALDGGADLAAGITPIRGFAGALDGAATLAPDLSLVASFTASFDGSADLVADVTVIVAAIEFAIALAGSADLAADLTALRGFAAGLNGSAALAPDVSAVLSFAAGLNGSADLAADLEIAALTVELAATLAGSATMAPDLSLIASLAAALQGGATFTADMETAGATEGAGKKKRRYILPDGRVVTDPALAYAELERQVRARAAELKPAAPKRKRKRSRSIHPPKPALMAEMPLPQLIERLPKAERAKVDMGIIEAARRLAEQAEEEERLIALLIMAA